MCVFPRSSLSGLRRGQRRGGCRHCRGVETCLGKQIEEHPLGSPSLPIFQNPLEAPESELPPLFGNKGSDSLSFLHNRDLYKLQLLGLSVAKETKTVTGPSVIPLWAEEVGPEATKDASNFRAQLLPESSFT